MSFKKRIRRSLKKKAAAGERRAYQQIHRMQQQERKAHYNQWVQSFNAETETMDNMLILWVYALNKVEHLNKRLDAWCEKFKRTSECIRGRYVTIPQIRKILRDERDFGVEGRGGRLKEEKEIVSKTIDDMLIVCSFVTYEVYSYRKERLARLIAYIQSVCAKLTRGEMTMDEIEVELKPKGIELERRALLKYAS